jgi:hypothetical protein
LQLRICLIIDNRSVYRRYRLGVRTGGSQPSNWGSIPHSATKLNPLKNCQLLLNKAF